MDDKLQVQYLGQSGLSALCLLGVGAILNSGCLPESATIVTHMSNRRDLQGDHLFLFWNWWHFPVTIVPSGFASGYGGEGPRSFSLAICMVASKGIPIYEAQVNRHFFEAIDSNRAPEELLREVKSKEESVTLPGITGSYVLPDHAELLESQKLWRKFWWCGSTADNLTVAIGRVDDYDSTVGGKLRQAFAKLDSEAVEDRQQAGLLARDAWIELIRRLSAESNADMIGISPDDVKRRLSKLKLENELVSLASSAFDLSKKIQHDRLVTNELVEACIVSTVVAMQALI